MVPNSSTRMHHGDYRWLCRRDVLTNRASNLGLMTPDLRIARAGGPALRWSSIPPVQPVEYPIQPGHIIFHRRSFSAQRWLLEKNRDEEARAVVHRLYGGKTEVAKARADEEFAIMRDAIKVSTGKEAGIVCSPGSDDQRFFVRAGIKTAVVYGPGNIR